MVLSLPWAEQMLNNQDQFMSSGSSSAYIQQQSAAIPIQELIGFGGNGSNDRADILWVLFVYLFT